MNAIVKYHNDLNGIAFRHFNKNELDLFFSICSQIRDKGENEITYTFEELKELCKYKKNDIIRFTNDLENTYTKMLNLNFRIETDESILKFVLFTDFDIKKSKKVVIISVNKKFKYILNELTSNFTRFELDEFISLNSSYSKTMYRLLKQFRNTGYYKIHIDEFRRLLYVPTSYKMMNIDQRILAPITNELSCYFHKLKITKVKAKKGNKIEFLEFKFEKEMPYVKGDKVFFKDKNNEYYSKSIYHLTAEELNHKFPADEVDPNQTVIDDFL